MPNLPMPFKIPSGTFHTISLIETKQIRCDTVSVRLSHFVTFHFRQTKDEFAFCRFGFTVPTCMNAHSNSSRPPYADSVHYFAVGRKGKEKKKFAVVAIVPLFGEFPPERCILRKTLLEFALPGCASCKARIQSI